MDTQFKTILLNEVNLRYIKNSLASVLLIIFLTYLIITNIHYYISPENKNITQMIYKFMLILFSCFSMVSLTDFYKYQREKSDRLYEIILTSPISLLKFTLSKLISLFLISYPVLICNFIIIFAILNTYNTDFFSIMSFNIELLVFIIAPLYLVLYSFVGLYMILRFNHANIIRILTLPFTVVVSIVVYLLLNMGSGSVLNEIFKFLGVNINSENTISFLASSILFLSVLGLLISFLIMFILMKKFNKEKIVTQ